MAKVELHTAEQVALRVQQILGLPNPPGIISWFPSGMGKRAGTLPCIKPVKTNKNYFLVTAHEFKRIEDAASAAVKNGFANAGQVRSRLLVSYSEAQDVQMYSTTELVLAAHVDRKTILNAIRDGKLDISWEPPGCSNRGSHFLFDQEDFDKALTYFKEAAARKEELKKARWEKRNNARIRKSRNTDPQQVSLPLATEGKITVNIKGMQIILDRADAEKLAESIVNQL